MSDEQRNTAGAGAGGGAPEPTGSPRPDAAQLWRQGVGELERIAGRAFADGRLGECLALCRAILKIDPGNREALEVQSSSEDRLQKDLRSARVLIGQARLVKSRELYEQAHGLLAGVLEADPGNRTAGAMLPEVHSHVSAPASAFPARSAVLFVVLAVISVGAAIQYGGPLLERMGGAGPMENARASGGQASAASRSVPTDGPAAMTGRLHFIVVPETGVRISVDGGPFEVLPSHMDLPPGPHELELTAEGFEPHGFSTNVSAGAQRVITAALFPAGAGPMPPASDTEPPTPDAPADRATPAPPQEPPQVTLQINARPWAEVFLEGPEMRPLGQTPLGEVRVPAGSVLVFRNPGFADKRHRVSGTEDTIRIEFP